MLRQYTGLYHMEDDDHRALHGIIIGDLCGELLCFLGTAEQSVAVNNGLEIQMLLRQRENLRQAARLSSTTRENRRLELRRERKKEFRQGWSRHQAVVDIERQLAGQTFEIAPESPSDESIYDRFGH
ncbi:hypothetical protein MAJ_10048, partial [Metarhizium majus ARSEF 297]